MFSGPFTIFNGKFRVKHLLGKGGFGEVYAGVQISTGENVAIKIECDQSQGVLFHESLVLQDIERRAGNCNAFGVPQIKYFGKEGDYSILVMSLHGLSLGDLLVKLGHLSLKTVAMVAHEMISRLEFLHSTDYIHRDLKPDNFLLGIGNFAQNLYIIDFGLSIRYRALDGAHKEMKTGKKFVGTSRYAACRTHQGILQSRRDDVEQLAYILIYLYRGRLPWSGLPIQDRDEKEKAIGKMKLQLSTGDICLKCPRQFEDLLIYARKMEYTEEPQYARCRLLISSILAAMNVKHDYLYDWVIRQEKTVDDNNDNSSDHVTKKDERVNSSKLTDHNKETTFGTTKPQDILLHLERCNVARGASFLSDC